MKCVLLALAITPLAMADTVTFDTTPEGFLDTVATIEGVTFFEGRWFPDIAIDTPFAIEQADGDFPAFGFDDIYSAPNVMTVGGFATGPSMGFIRVHSWKAIVEGETFNKGSVDVFYINDFTGATLMLEGLVGETIVASDSYETTGGDPFVPQHQHLEFSGPEYDTLRFRIMGGPEQDGLVAVFDNVVLESGGCAADCNGDGELNVLDFVCFQGEFQAGADDADCNGDGQLNVLDFVCFQGEFQKGCG